MKQEKLNHITKRLERRLGYNPIGHNHKHIIEDLIEKLLDLLDAIEAHNNTLQESKVLEIKE